MKYIARKCQEAYLKNKKGKWNKHISQIKKNHDVSLYIKNFVVEKFTEERQTLKFGGNLFDVRKIPGECQEEDCALKCLECPTCLYSCLFM